MSAPLDCPSDLWVCDTCSFLPLESKGHLVASRPAVNLLHSAAPALQTPALLLPHLCTGDPPVNSFEMPVPFTRTVLVTLVDQCPAVALGGTPPLVGIGASVSVISCSPRVLSPLSAICPGLRSPREPHQCDFTSSLRVPPRALQLLSQESAANAMNSCFLSLKCLATLVRP